VPSLAYQSFTIAARERLALRPGTLALIEMPDSRLDDACHALRARLRRNDALAACDETHVVVLLVDVTPAIARERLADMVVRLGPGDPPRFHVGIISSTSAGALGFDTMLKSASEAVVTARDRGVLVAVSGEVPPAPASAVTPDATPAFAPRGGTVVIADDDPDVTRLIDAQVRAAGYRTVLVSDGQQALAAVEKHRPALVIVDMMMPRVTGLDVLTALRHQPGRPRIIVLSARGREQDITRAFALGADDYVTKPFSPQELLARMERLLRPGAAEGGSHV
jgi:CheY-like chemotaxis protein